MSDKHILNNKRRWANVSPEARSVIMTKLAKKKAKSLTPMQRKQIGANLARARKAKGI